MPSFRIAQAAQLLGVSDDTVRRWVETGRLRAARDRSDRAVVDGAALAEIARHVATPAPDPTRIGRSARNKLAGLVTSVSADEVMAQVVMQCGPDRVVSLISAESVQELGLRPGSLVVAVIKSTDVVVQVPPAATAPGAVDRSRRRPSPHTAGQTVARSERRDRTSGTPAPVSTTDR